MDNLQNFLLISSFIEAPTRLEMDLAKLLEKSEFMKLVRDGQTKELEKKDEES